MKTNEIIDFITFFLLSWVRGENNCEERINKVDLILKLRNSKIKVQFIILKLKKKYLLNKYFLFNRRLCL